MVRAEKQADDLQKEIERLEQGDAWREEMRLSRSK